MSPCPQNDYVNISQKVDGLASTNEKKFVKYYVFVDHSNLPRIIRRMPVVGSSI